MANDQSVPAVGFVGYKTMAFIREIKEEKGWSMSATIAWLIEQQMIALGYPIENNRRTTNGHRNKHGVSSVVRPMARKFTNER